MSEPGPGTAPEPGPAPKHAAGPAPEPGPAPERAAAPERPMLERSAAPERSVLETYLAGVDPTAAPLVVVLDGAIREAHPGFDAAIKYGILMYALGGDWRTWVCAIDATRKTVGLRFLYGVLMDDTKHVLRAGSSVLKTWDFAFDAVVDRASVGAYVREAVDRYPDYKANTREVLEASRAAARSRNRARPG